MRRNGGRSLRDTNSSLNTSSELEVRRDGGGVSRKWEGSAGSGRGQGGGGGGCRPEEVGHAYVTLPRNAIKSWTTSVPRLLWQSGSETRLAKKSAKEQS